MTEFQPDRDLSDEFHAAWTAEGEVRRLRQDVVVLRQKLYDAMLWVPFEAQEKLRAQWEARERIVRGDG